MIDIILDHAIAADLAVDRHHKLNSVGHRCGRGKQERHRYAENPADMNLFRPHCRYLQSVGRLPTFISHNSGDRLPMMDQRGQNVWRISVCGLERVDRIAVETCRYIRNEGRQAILLGDLRTIMRTVATIRIISGLRASARERAIQQIVQQIRKVQRGVVDVANISVVLEAAPLVLRALDQLARGGGFPVADSLSRADIHLAPRVAYFTSDPTGETLLKQHDRLYLVVGDVFGEAFRRDEAGVTRGPQRSFSK
jgi:hypothetical protein